MYFTDDSLFPENMQPLIVTAAPFGPEWLPGDVEDLPLTWDQQVQAAVDCYNAGATMLHVHVRDPKTGQGSSNFEEYNYLIGRLRAGRPQDDPAGRRLDLLCAAHVRGQGQVARLRHAAHAHRARSQAGLRDGHDGHHLVGHHAGLRFGRRQGDASRRSQGAGRLERHGRGLNARLLRRASQAPACARHPALLRPRPRPSARDHRAPGPLRHIHGTAECRPVRLRRRVDGPQPLRLDGDASPHAARRLHCHFLEQHARQHRDPEPCPDSRRPCPGRQRRQYLGCAKAALAHREAGRVGSRECPSSSAARSRPRTRRAR